MSEQEGVAPSASRARVVAPATPAGEASAGPHAPTHGPDKPHRGGFLKRVFGFLGWVLSGFGLFHLLAPGKSRYKTEEIVVYSVHRSFYLWLLILTGFLGSFMVNHNFGSPAAWGWIYVWALLFTFFLLLFDIGTLKFLLWVGIFSFLWLIGKYVEAVKQVPVLHAVTGYLRNLHPVLSPGFAAVMSWLLLGPWVGALFHSFSRGRKTFSPNSIEEWYLGEGREITDRSGLKFRSRYRDLLEMVLGFGAGDLEAVDSTQHVVKRWENIIFLAFVWRRLDEILHQRSAVVDNAAEDPVEVETVRR